MNDLEQLLTEQANLYDKGDEQTSQGVLVSPGYRFFDTQEELVTKVKHLNEFPSDAETARKALMIGLNMLAAGFVDEDVAQNLKNSLSGGEE